MGSTLRFQQFRRSKPIMLRQGMEHNIFGQTEYVKEPTIKLP